MCRKWSVRFRAPGVGVLGAGQLSTPCRSAQTQCEHLKSGSWAAQHPAPQCHNNSVSQTQPHRYSTEYSRHIAGSTTRGTLLVAQQAHVAHVFTLKSASPDICARRAPVVCPVEQRGPRAVLGIGVHTTAADILPGTMMQSSTLAKIMPTGTKLLR